VLIPVDLPKIRATTGDREHRMLPGKLDPKDLPLMQRAPLFLFRGMKGDVRRWEAIRALATVIADALQQNHIPAH
jgi:hypothetical protein